MKKMVHTQFLHQTGPWRLRLMLALMLVLEASVTPMAGQGNSWDQIKAADLLNFARFTEWPQGTVGAGSSPLNICTLGRSGTTSELGYVAGSRTINGHTISLRPISSPEEIHGCNVVFLAADSGKRQQKLIDATQGTPVLLVAEIAGFAHNGGLIDMSISNGRVVFEV